MKIAANVLFKCNSLYICFNFGKYAPKIMGSADSRGNRRHNFAEDWGGVVDGDDG
jgi:hypothetical protein